MATDTFVNILDLAPITEVVNGDYLIVETPAGTRIIDFKNFILPNANLLLADAVATNTTAILSNYDASINNIQSISSAISDFNTTLTTVSSKLNTTIGAVSSTINNKISLSAAAQQDYTDLSITNLSSSLTTIINTVSGKAQHFYLGKSQATINIGANQTTVALQPYTTLQLSALDITITPYNAYAAKNLAYITDISSSNMITITAPFSGTGTALSAATYNIFAMVSI